jgi:hypothetical protein
MRGAAAVTLLTLAGCSFGPSLGNEPFRCGTSPSECPPGYHCVADLCESSHPVADAGGGGASPDARPPADAPPAGSCTASTTTCNGDNLVTCDSGGHATTVPCALGCNAAVSPAVCLTLSPSNLDASSCDRGPLLTGIAYPSGPTQVSTDDCTGGSVVAQASAGPDLCVFHYSDITVPADAVVTFVGHRIPVLVATGSISLEGTIDVSAKGPRPGPGASGLALVVRGASGDSGTGAGAGGGGHLTAGGSGGTAAGTSTSEAGGAAGGNPALSPISGGGFGGIGGRPCVNLCPTPLDSRGGAGGGAIEMVGCQSLTIGAAAMINAGGGGGPGGDPPTVDKPPGGGDGGGAGGSILLEAPVLNLPSGATLVANGGGGGGGGSRVASALAGGPGEDGAVVVKPAGGGASSAGKGGEGGTGGGANGTSPPKPGGNGDSAGGGGGAAGRIRLNTRSGHATVASGVITSPGPVQGSVAVH